MMGEKTTFEDVLEIAADCVTIKVNEQGFITFSVLIEFKIINNSKTKKDFLLFVIFSTLTTSARKSVNAKTTFEVTLCICS
jgi:hypothetical protein